MGIPYEVNQQATISVAASITATTSAGANTFLTTDKQRSLLSVTSTLNQPVIIQRNGVFWHYLAASVTAPASAIWDVGSDGGYFGVGVSFSVYAVSATPTAGTLYGMAL